MVYTSFTENPFETLRVKREKTCGAVFTLYIFSWGMVDDPPPTKKVNMLKKPSFTSDLKASNELPILRSSLHVPCCHPNMNAILVFWNPPGMPCVGSRLPKMSPKSQLARAKLVFFRSLIYTDLTRCERNWSPWFLVSFLSLKSSTDIIIPCQNSKPRKSSVTALRFWRVDIAHQVWTQHDTTFASMVTNGLA